MTGIVDLHSHVLPGVDDGASDVAEAVTAVEALFSEGVTTVVATPHLSASLEEQAGVLESRLEYIDRAHAELQTALTTAGYRGVVHRGAEIKLNSPNPDLSDPRLRIAATRFVLVEFPGFRIPPFAGNQFASLVENGWWPVLAHAERHAGIEDALPELHEWKRAGVCIQINAGSFLGQYGERAQLAVASLLSLGVVDYLASDYHARGEIGVVAALEVLREHPNGEEISALLAVTNPRRLLDEEHPLAVPALEPLERTDGKGFRQLLSSLGPGGARRERPPDETTESGSA